MTDAIKRDPKDAAALSAQARLLLKDGQLADYRKTCAALSALAADGKDAALTRRLAATCTSPPTRWRTSSLCSLPSTRR